MVIGPTIVVTIRLLTVRITKSITVTTMDLMIFRTSSYVTLEFLHNASHDQSHDTWCDIAQ